MKLFETTGLARSRQFAHNAAPIPVSGCRGSTSRKAVTSREQCRIGQDGTWLSPLRSFVVVAGLRRRSGGPFAVFLCLKPGSPVYRASQVPQTGLPRYRSGGQCGRLCDVRVVGAQSL